MAEESRLQQRLPTRCTDVPTELTSFETPLRCTEKVLRRDDSDAPTKASDPLSCLEMTRRSVSGDDDLVAALEIALQV